MKKVSEILKNVTLTPEELNGKPVEVPIVDVELVEYDDGEKVRLAFEFDGEERERTMNKTNMRELARMFGDDPAEWVGKTVTFIPTRVAFKDKIVPTIIVAEATAKAAKPQAAPKPQSAPSGPAPDADDPGPGDDHFAGIVSDEIPDWRAS